MGYSLRLISINDDTPSVSMPASLFSDVSEWSGCGLGVHKRGARSSISGISGLDPRIHHASGMSPIQLSTAAGDLRPSYSVLIVVNRLGTFEL